MDLYSSKRPTFPAGNPDNDVFYLRPVGKFDPMKPWYYTRAIGHNTLKGMLKSICQEAGIPFENKSNHSLRATATTRLIDGGIAEKVIMDRTGHRSLDGLKPYARTNDQQQQHVSEVIACPLVDQHQQLVLADQQRALEGISTASKEITSMYTESSTITKTQYVDEKMKRIITNQEQISGCVFNISVKF